MSFKNKLILGTAQFAGNYGFEKNSNSFKEYNIKKIIKYFKNKNFNTLDTSLEYKKVDEKIGLIKNKNWKIITKIKFSNKEIKNLDEKSIKKKIKKKLTLSQRNIGIKKFDTLLIHNFEVLNLINKKKIFKALVYLKKRDNFKKIGFSIYNFKKLKTIINKFKPDVIQCSFNVFDRRLDNPELSKIIKKNKVEVHARSIFLQGLLLSDPFTLPKKFIKWKNLIYKWHSWSEKNNISKVEASLSLANFNKNINKIVFGIQNFSQLKEILNIKIRKFSVPKALKSNDENLINPSKW